MNDAPVPADPLHRRSYRAFKAATEFGVLTSATPRPAADQHVVEVNGPVPASEALTMRQHARKSGLQAVVVARYRRADGRFDWFDVYGRTAVEVLTEFASARHWADPTSSADTPSLRRAV